VQIKKNIVWLGIGIFIMIVLFGVWKILVGKPESQPQTRMMSGQEAETQLPDTLSTTRVFRKPEVAKPQVITVPGASQVPGEEDQSVAAARTSEIFLPLPPKQTVQEPVPTITPEEQARMEEAEKNAKDIQAVALNHNQIEWDGRPVIRQGTVIPAVLATGLNSDLPGYATAVVSQSVYDSVDGSYLLIPQGTKLFGAYNAEIKFEQERVFLAWSRMMFPDGSWISMAEMPTVDQAGFSGLKDKVDNHWGPMLLGAVLVTILESAQDILPELVEDDNGQNNNNIDVGGAADEGTTNLSDVFQDYADRHMDRQPTLVIRPGFRLNVMVNKDIHLKPYGGQQIRDMKKSLGAYERPYEEKITRKIKWLN
jgi:type IV secretion system protein VirB10